ncbi:MAG: TIGR04255 family protein [Candidatus Pacebacteria bacterium]|nr:TIGR04255 family protein [Candidatus Paceibacterota bacterium]
MAPKKQENNIFKKAIFRIDCREIDLSQIKAFSDSIKEEFPFSEKKEEKILSIDINTQNFQQDNVVPIWKISNKLNTKIITITPTSLSIEYLKYKNFNELLLDISKAENFLKDSGVKTVTKVGLRQINEIKNTKKDFLNWGEYIEDSFIENLNFIDSKNKKIARAMSQIIFKDEIGNINLNYGIWNSNFPNEIIEKIFVLDIDVRSQFPISIDELDIELIKSYNEKIREILDLTVKEALKGVI